MLKKLLSLCVLLIVSIITLLPTQVKAVTTGRTYFYIIGNSNIDCYSSSTDNTKFGSVYTTDKCYFEGSPQIANGRIKITYPISSGIKVAWVNINNVFANGINFFNTSEYTANIKMTTYTKSNLVTEFGYISIGDKIRQSSPSGNVQVIYPIPGGDRKLAWTII